MPTPPKQADRRQRRNATGAGLVVIPITPVAVPPAPTGLLNVTKDRWSTFWRSPPARLVLSSDGFALERLFRLYDERERSYRTVRAPARDAEGRVIRGRGSRLVEGSKGQPRLNPLLTVIPTLDAEIRALEDRFGLTPLARLRLGVTFGEAATSLDALNAQLEDDEEPDADPRLTVLDAAAADPRADRL